MKKTYPEPSIKDGKVSFNFVRTLYLLRLQKSKGLITDTEYRSAKAYYESAMHTYLVEKGLV